MLPDLGIIPGRNGVEMGEQLKDVLVGEARVGRSFVVDIEEAQNLSDDALEMVRLLRTFETSKAKLMQIVLSSQPKLLRSSCSHHWNNYVSAFQRFAGLSPFQQSRPVPTSSTG